jgi:hypothetical protein
MEQGVDMFAKKALSIGIAGALGLLCAPAFAGPVVHNNAVEIVGAGAAADPLIAVEANRAAIINRIVVEHGDTLAAAGVSQESFRNALRSLRADQLLAASLVNSVEEITAIVSQSPSDGSAMQRFVAVTPIEATSMSQMPSAEAYLVRDGETLTIVKAANLQLGAGVQLVGYFAPATTSVTVSASTAVAFTPKDGSGTGTGSWIGYTAGFNQATGLNSAVAAGSNNLASGQGAFVGAGTANQANGLSSLVIGGFDNRAVGIDSLVGAGAGNRATASRSVIVGGGYNLASGGWSFIGGGGRDGTESTPAGTDTRDHIASGNFSTIGGGQGNRAGTVSKAFATVSGGGFNTASGLASTVVGGQSNTASGDRSAVLGGTDNVASGRDSIAVGCGAVATNAGSFVFSATAANPCGSDPFFSSIADNEFAVRSTGGARFVTAVNVAGTPTQTVKINANGAVDFSANPFEESIILPGAAKTIGTQPNIIYMRSPIDFFWFRGGSHSSTAGDPGVGGTVLASLTSGASASTVTGTFRVQVITATSDRNQKTAFETLSPTNILAKVAAMPVMLWSYKNETGTGVRHIGPVAQDFMRLFNVGYDDKSIATVDADGVAFAAIQGLNQKIDEKDARIEMLERELSAIKAKLGMN